MLMLMLIQKSRGEVRNEWNVECGSMAEAQRLDSKFSAFRGKLGCLIDCRVCCSFCVCLLAACLQVVAGPWSVYW
jgi:hypothetical protein